MQDIILLKCGSCNNKNYSTTKNKKKHTDRLEIKRFCPKCRQHRPHREVK